MLVVYIRPKLDDLGEFAFPCFSTIFAGKQCKTRLNTVRNTGKYAILALNLAKNSDFTSNFIFSALGDFK